MRILFTTQSESLGLFEALRSALDRRVGVERAGFIVADSLSYSRWSKENPGFEHQGHVLLKEWRVTGAGYAEPDLGLLAGYESKIGGEPGLFGALVADRRLFMGRDCTYSQDYRRRFDDKQLLGILQRGLEETERLFDELKPDVVAGFVCVTMLDYLAYLFAKARGVKVLNLRPSRVGDLIAFASNLNDPSPEFVTAYRHALAHGSPHLESARSHIRRVREEHGRYEGVVMPSAKPALKINPAKRSLLAGFLQVMRNYGDYAGSEAAQDNHVPHPLRALLFAGVLNPLRARFAAAQLDSVYTTPGALRGTRFAFFPLHTEPEVTLLVYGRPYLNQIEVIRALAISLPVDMFLVVKEHPWMVGKRSLSSYRKLLNIPKVLLASPASEARDWVIRSDLTAVITGSVALEAAILGKPVITFADCPYNALPPFMVRRCDDLRRLQIIVRELLDGYRLDEGALEAYISGVFDSSESINLYSVLLKKRAVFSERDARFSDEIEKLAGYTVRMVNEPLPVAAVEGAAGW